MGYKQKFVDMEHVFVMKSFYQIGGLLSLVDVLLIGGCPTGSIELAALITVSVPIESISSAISHPPSLATGNSSPILVGWKIDINTVSSASVLFDHP